MPGVLGHGSFGLCQVCESGMPPCFCGFLACPRSASPRPSAWTRSSLPPVQPQSLERGSTFWLPGFALHVPWAWFSAQLGPCVSGLFRCHLLEECCLLSAHGQPDLALFLCSSWDTLCSSCRLLSIFPLENVAPRRRTDLFSNESWGWHGAWHIGG